MTEQEAKKWARLHKNRTVVSTCGTKCTVMSLGEERANRHTMLARKHNGELGRFYICSILTNEIQWKLHYDIDTFISEIEEL